jgi:hypothetical protein
MRPLITEGPRWDELLPSDDSAWDEGVLKPSIDLKRDFVGLLIIFARSRHRVTQ